MAKIPPFLQPRLRLFLSADVIGSTALKQSKLGAHKEYHDQGDGGPAWFSAIQGFYFEAAQAFLSEWAAANDDSGDPKTLYGPSPTVWKTIGDEVLFAKEITDHRQITVTLQVWQKALKRIRMFLEDEVSNLGVKSTCWVAGFPFKNREVVVDKSYEGKTEEDYYSANGRRLNLYYESQKRGVEPSIILDFVGPSIDTGFRISQFANARKLTISIDVAYLISMTQFDGEVRRVDIYYDGSTNLKGVLGGNNYPIFWIDVSDDESLFRREDKLQAISPADKEDIREYCEAFYKEHEGFVFRPFIDGDVGGVLSKKPDWYQKYQEVLFANFEDKNERYNTGPARSAQSGKILPDAGKKIAFKTLKDRLADKRDDAE